MTKTSIRGDVRAFVIGNFICRADELTDEESLLEAGIIDSTGVLEMVGYLETVFGITVEDAELVPANLDSIASVSAFVERKLQDEKARRAG